MRVTVFGVDRRFIYAAEYLSRRGYRAERYAPGAGLAPILLLPVPASRDGATVTGFPGVPIGDLLAARPRLILGGNLSGGFTAAARRAGIAVRDYMNAETFVLKNASLTSDAALGILLSESSAAPRENPTAIIGFGRIGKFLSRGLLSLGCPVTVFARDPRDRTMATLIGARARDTKDLGEAGALAPYRTVVNTAPARLVPRAAVGALAPGSLLLELASGEGNLPNPEPGSGVTLRRANGLPGRVFPESAGLALGETAHDLIREVFPDGRAEEEKTDSP